jgi:pimeloyl-ACP methyl ester carboxylesterase
MPSVLSRDGSPIWYESSGHGIPVILLHPNNATAGSWKDLGWFEALAELGLRAIALDARGFGASAAIERTEQLLPGTTTDDIAAVMDSLELESAHICGFSLGAACAARFAIDAPDRVHCLVLGGLARGPLAQMGLYVGRSATDARREAIRQVDRRIEESSPDAMEYFRAVRELISGVALTRLAGVQSSFETRAANPSSVHPVCFAARSDDLSRQENP